MSTIAQLVIALARDFNPGDHVAVLVPSAEDPTDIAESELLEITGLVGIESGVITEDGATNVRVAALTYSRVLSNAIKARDDVDQVVIGEDGEEIPGDDSGPVCCIGECCGPGSYCCKNAGPHEHDEEPS